MCEKCVQAKLIDDLASAERLLADIDTLYGPIGDQDVILPDLSVSELAKPAKSLVFSRNGVTTRTRGN